MTYEVGQKVRWVSSNVEKLGEIVAVVPVGDSPRGVGYPKAGGGGDARDHVSYIVKAKKLGWGGQPYGSSSAYWPVVSLLKPA